MLNKHNLAITEFASKEESRYNLQAIQITPDATIATNGHILAWVSTPSTEESTFPVVPGAPEPTRQHGNFLLHVDAAKAITKALPRKTTLPVLGHVAIGLEERNGQQMPALTVTDLENPQTFRPGVPEGRFPNYEAVMPKFEKAKFVINMNPELLLTIAKAYVSFQKNTRQTGIRISFYGDKEAIRFDGTNEQTGQGMTCVAMPLRGDKDPQGTYGYAERHPASPKEEPKQTEPIPTEEPVAAA